MSPWHRPPPGLAAREVLESWLPQAFAAAPRRPTPDSPAVRITLSGPEGGDWNLQADEDELHVERRAPGRSHNDEEPAIWLRQSVADFLALLHGDPDLPGLLPDGVGVIELLCLDGGTLALVRQLGGRLRLEIEGRRRRRWAIDAAFGLAGRRAGHPRSSVRIDTGTCDKLATGELHPLQALLSGKLLVEGDRALVMQTVMAFNGKLGR